MKFRQILLLAAACATAPLLTGCGTVAAPGNPVVEIGPQYPGIAAWCVADALDGKIVLAHAADQRRPVASLTKIATCLVALDFMRQSQTDAGQLMTVPFSVAAIGTPSPVGLQPGDQISIRDGLFAAMMASDNFAAETLATHIGARLSGVIGGAPEAAFVKQMNGLSRTVGLRDTNFTNAHGLELTGQRPYSTAADMARLAIFAQRQAGFTYYTSQKQRGISWVRGGLRQSKNVYNTNALLGKGNIDGVKTGTTAAAGPCLVITAARPSTVQNNPDGSSYVTPNRLVVVELCATQDRFSQAWQLLQDGWQAYNGWRASGSQVQSNGELLRQPGAAAPARQAVPAAPPVPSAAPLEVPSAPPPSGGVFGAPPSAPYSPPQDY